MQTNKIEQSRKKRHNSENVIHSECKHKQISFGILNQGARNSCCRHAKVFNHKSHARCEHQKFNFIILSNNVVVNTFRVMTFCRLTYIYQMHNKKNGMTFNPRSLNRSMKKHIQTEQEMKKLRK